MALTVNELWRDALTRRQIALSRYTKGLQADVIALLDGTEQDVRATLQDRLAELEGKDFSATTNSRLNVLANAIAKIRQDAFDSTSEMMDQHMRDLATAEADFLDSTLQDLSPVLLDTVLPDPDLLTSLVDVQPMQGQLLEDWLAGLSDLDQQRIMNSIRSGMAQGMDTQSIIRDVLGSQSVNGTDGVVDLTRNNLASIVQTSVATISGEAQQAYTDANSDIFKQELYVAVLDANTTPECQALDGQVFDVGDGPEPPIHWNCRSRRVPTIDGKAIGNRPASSVAKGQLDGLSRADKRDAVDKLVGQVPATTTYQDWLSGQTAAFQDSVLGPTRGALFRDGGLTLDKFVNKNLDTLTLDELRKAEPQAFKQAGL